MAGTREGYEKAHQKLLAMYGGPEGLKKHRQEIGRKGGKRKTVSTKRRGFASMTTERHHEVSSMGGKHNRPPK